eukprot:2631915-Rhodomonas_salina.2
MVRKTVPRLSWIETVAAVHLRQCISVKSERVFSRGKGGYDFGVHLPDPWHADIIPPSAQHLSGTVYQKKCIFAALLASGFSPSINVRCIIALCHALGARLRFGRRMKCQGLTAFRGQVPSIRTSAANPRIAAEGTGQFRCQSHVSEHHAGNWAGAGRQAYNIM